ncbi:MAG: hypothetical protein ACTSWY_09130 [Promethearchaeota archaeon]
MMLNHKVIPAFSKIYYMDVFDEIETILRFCTEKEIINTIHNRIFGIINSIGSELELFLDFLSKKFNIPVFKINSMKRTILNGKDENIPESNIINELKFFLDKKKGIITEVKKEPIGETEDKGIFTEKDKSNYELNINNNEDIKNIEKKEKINENTILFPDIKLILLENGGFYNEDIIKFNDTVIDYFARYSNFKTDNNSIPFLMVISDSSVLFPREIAVKFDLSFHIPFPDKIQRIEILETLFNKIHIHTVDISKLSSLTKGWNVKDLKHLVKTGYIKWRIANFKEFEERRLEAEKNAEHDDKKNIISKTEDEISSNKKETSNNPDKFPENKEKDIKKNGENNTNKTEEQMKITPKEKEEDNQKEESGNNIKMTPNFNFKGKLDYVIPFTVDFFRDIIAKEQIIPLKRYLSSNTIKYISHSGDFYGIRRTYSPYALGKSETGRNNYNFLFNEEDTLQLEGKISNEQKEEDYSPKGGSILRGINITELNSFTSGQLYQFAATNKFDELILILEKLDRGQKLDEVDRKILVDFPFVLNDEPKKAIMKLTNSKNRIDRIRNISRE